MLGVVDDDGLVAAETRHVLRDTEMDTREAGERVATSGQRGDIRLRVVVSSAASLLLPLWWGLC